MKNPLHQDIWSEEVQAEAMALKGPILILGASGFIGAKLFFSLIQRRSDVYAATRHPGWRHEKLPNEAHPENFVHIDLTDFQQTEDTIRRIQPATVFNLSAYGAYERQRDAAQIYKVNFTATANLLSILREQGCEAYVHAGSSSEYGLNCQAPKEGDSLLPNSDYAVAKGASSLLISYYGKVLGLPCTNLRLYSIFGPFEDRDRLIPRLVTEGMNGRYPPLVNREIARDFVYVDDCTSAFIRATTTVCKSAPGSSINIGRGIKVTLEDVAKTTAEVFEIPEPASFGSMPNRKWDLSNWYAKTELAEQKMNWKATTDFVTGLKLTKEWEIQARKQLSFSVSHQSNKKISAIVACYRDHEAIPIMYQNLSRAFQSIGINYEIIFVNDRSPTQDELEIKKLCAADSRVVGISHARNFGSQSAFLSGMGIANGDAVVLLDGDLQDPPELIPALVEKWREGFDVVYGTRVKREAPIHMQLFYKLFYRTFKRLSNIEIPLDAGDFSLIDRKVVHHLINLTEKDVFLRGLRAWVGFKQIGVPYVRPERRFGRSTNSFVKNIWWAKKAIFSFSLMPLSLIQALGVTMFCLSLILAIIYLVMHFIFPGAASPGITTIILLVLGLGGVQLLSISIIGDYLGKVLEEVKNRPRFIREKVISGTQVFESAEEYAQTMVHHKRGGIHGQHRR